MKKTKVYISGKITGTSDYVKRFGKVERKLAKKFDVVNPVTITADLPTGTTWSTYMKKVIPFLCECDAIYMLDGWRQSRGACLERELALNLGIKVMYGDSDVFDKMEKIEAIGRVYQDKYGTWGMSNCARAFHQIMKVIDMEVEE